MKTKETPLFIMESEKRVFAYRHPEYQYYTEVYYKDETLAGLLTYKNKPE